MMQSIVRTRSLMVELDLKDVSKLDSIIEYWSSSKSDRKKDIEPIVRSINATEGVNALGIAHVLPPLARKLLYTYPSPNYSLHGSMPDCHWTTLNFFNFEPHQHLLDERFTTSFMKDKCIPAETPQRFGDFVFLSDPKSNEILHSCVYLADDLVYTKNGKNWLAPWVIMKLRDVSAIYSRDQNPKLSFLRLK